MICACVAFLVCGCAPPAAAPPRAAQEKRAVEPAPTKAQDVIIARAMSPASQLAPFKVLQASSRRLELVQYEEHVLHHRAAVTLEDGRLGVFRFSDDDESLPTHRWEAAINGTLGVVGVISLGGEGSVAAFQVVRFDETSGRWVAGARLEPPYHMSDLMRLTVKDGALQLMIRVIDCADCGLEGDYLYQSADHGQSWRLMSAP